MSSMARTILVPRLQQALGARRWNSGSGVQSPLVTVEADAKNERIAILALNKPPVNSLNLEMLQSLTSAIDGLEERLDSLDGVIITSTSKNIFSAGLDLKELLRPDRQRLLSFCSTFQQFWLRLYSCKVTVASAIAGHAPAGGTLIALCSDFRVSVDDPKIRMGLNEAQFGLAPPSWLARSMASVIGQRASERALMMGTMFSPGEALKIGLVDELAANGDEAVDKCRDAIKVFSTTDTRARAFAKEFARRPFSRELKDNFDEDLHFYVDAICSDYSQAKLDSYLGSLSKKKS